VEVIPIYANNNNVDTGALLKTIEENVEEYDINVKGNVV